MAREYFCAYHSYLDAMEALTDDERGRLFTACLTYSKTGEILTLTGNERFVFPIIKGEIQRSKEKYAAYIETQTENGKKGGRPRKPKETQKTQAFFEKPKKGNEKAKENEKANVKEMEKENMSPLSADSPSPSDSFEKFWSVYPKKANKEAAIKAWSRLSPDETLTEQILKAVEKQKKSKQWTDDSGQFIPYPATWLSQGRWEDELELAKERHTSYDIDELEKMSFFDVPEDL